MISPRAMSRNQEWRVVKITEVNPTTNHIQAEDQYGTPLMCDITGQALLLQIPVVGEMWTVSRRGSDWLLERRYENPDTQLPITGMNPGDARIEASGAISILGEAVNIPNLTGLYRGTGVPAANLGVNGDYYFRQDGTTGAHIYFKSSGTWSALV